MSTITGLAIKIQGIPEVSPFSVLNGRTGHVVEGPIRPHGLVRIRLTFPITSDDVALSFGPDGSADDFGSDVDGYEVSILEKFLVDAPVVEPGRLIEDMGDLSVAALLEIRGMARRARRDGSSELWAMAAEKFATFASLGEIIPESVVTPEDARAWVHAYAAATSFGF